MLDALVLCEGKFGTTTGKTAAGLVRRSYKYRIVGVLDSSKAGEDAGEVLDGRPNGIPIFSGVANAIESTKPSCLIIGVATVGGRLPPEFKPVIREAILAGLSVVSGLHEYISEDAELSALAKEHGVRLEDIRRPPPLDMRHHFADRVRHIPALRIPVLGTDSAVGKRTTAWELTDALDASGIKTAFVATGQTGLLQGAKFGVPLDSIPGDFIVGELENAIMSAWEAERPDVIVVEGQGALSHPAYVCGSRAICMASQPSGVVLQHAPQAASQLPSGAEAATVDDRGGADPGQSVHQDGRHRADAQPRWDGPRGSGRDCRRMGAGARAAGLRSAVARVREAGRSGPRHPGAPGVRPNARRATDNSYIPTMQSPFVIL